MHYYQFNIADYRKDTQHLTPIEHYIYRELIDWYYLDESPIPKITKVVIRRLRLVSENNQDLENVLEEFFTETEEGWVHERISCEISKYHARVDTAKANGSKGGRPKKPKKTNSVNLGSENKPTAKLTNNQEPITNIKDIYGDSARRVIEHLNNLAGKKYKNTDANRTPIIARFKDGFTEDDCFRVIANRCGRWLGTEQAQYLRPDTLFRPSKFESYLNDTGETNAANRPGGHTGQNRQSKSDAIREATFSDNW